MIKKLTKELLVMMPIILSSNITQAQVSINSSGLNISGSGGNITYSIGQNFYNTNIGNEGSVAQGLLSTYQISILDIEDIEANITLVAYPNPILDILTIQIYNSTKKDLSYNIYNLNGTLLNSGPLDIQATSISTKDLSSGIYFIYILNKDKSIVQTFKIIKS